jgi:phosphotriesterase-related protein
LDEIERAGCDPERFIWIHTSEEPDFACHLEMAQRGVWIEYDTIGDGRDAMHLERVLRVFDAGLGHRLLLSQDRGWYDAAQPGGGRPRSFDYLTTHFLPQLRASGLGDAAIRQITRDNPFRAFARGYP